MKSNLPSELHNTLCKELNVADISFTPVGGGSINQTGQLVADKRLLFLKWNKSGEYPGMLRTEFDGLQKLRSVNAIDVVEPLIQGDTGSFQYLVLDFIKSSQKQSKFWKDFGEKLAHLHLNTSSMYGLDHDNYMGALPQKNTYRKTFVEFLINNRLMPQVGLAVYNNLIPASVAHAFDVLYGKLENLIPEEQPALIHGDLWSGNLMCNKSGLPVLIDPATHYGNGEVDLAMTTLFGGFDPVFFDAYISVKSLIPGYKLRFGLYNLYPLLVHVNLFGKSYLPQVVSILKNYVYMRDW